MTQLYTSIAHTKIAMQNGGAPPPITQFAPEWRARFDMDSVLGLGALIEDRELGLKCPFKDCPAYCHSLSPHVRAFHGVSAEELKKALGLPPSMSLLSKKAREKMSMIQQRLFREGRSGIVKAIAKGRELRKRYAKRPEAKRWRPKTKGLSVAARNWRGSCNAQLGEKLKNAVDESGVSNMTQATAIEVLGYSLFKKVIRTYGTWNTAKAVHGLPVRFRMARRLEMKQVVDSFSAFEKKYGRFPSSGEAQRGHYAPLIPSYNPVMRVTKAKTWREACDIIRKQIA